ncbi:MAG: hypothetical protein Q9224_003149 [Gallowayella concinna]
MDAQTDSLLHREEDPMICLKCSERKDIRNRTSEHEFKNFQSLVVLLSMTLNIALATWLVSQKADAARPEPSKYAGLLRNVPLAWNPYSPYGLGNKNESDRSIMWERLDSSPGTVSLDKTWTIQHDLPAAQDFPWDRSRSLYLLNGHHSLHCLTAAKDAGLHQTRMCRSWNHLNRWAKQQTSCYVFINETQGVSTTFNRYKWCPKDSLYAKKMLIHLNLPPGRYEERPAEIDSMPQYWVNFQDNILKFDENTAV